MLLNNKYVSKEKILSIMINYFQGGNSFWTIKFQGGNPQWEQNLKQCKTFCPKSKKPKALRSMNWVINIRSDIKTN